MGSSPRGGANPRERTTIGITAQAKACGSGGSRSSSAVTLSRISISKRFADLLGGDIAVVETKIGRGSTFRATVTTGSLDGVTMLDDLASETVVTDTAHAAAHITPFDLKGIRILLAEDRPDNQRLISFVLKKQERM